MTENFEYFAFISYKREDEYWAKWVQEQIESYHIPTVVRKEIPRLPKKIYPVFRDKTDLGGGGLVSSLHAELESSRFLIVICSPASAKSDWVGKEIEHFISLGREKQVIPFIINGEPHSENPKEECLHPIFSTFKDEPLAINIQEIGKEQALVKTVAQLLGLKFNVLWDRFQRRERLKRIYAAVACVLFLLASIFVWDYTRVKSVFFADYVIRNGIPEGIIELSNKDLEHRQYYYKFDYSQNKLRCVTYCDWFGNPTTVGNTEFQDRFSIQEFSYENGECKSITYYNSIKTPILIGRFTDSSHSKMDLLNYYNGNSTLLNSDANHYAKESILDADFNFNTGWPIEKSIIGRFTFRYNKDGYLISKLYNPIGRDILVADRNGIAGLEYQLDECNRVVSIYYLDREERHCSNAQGVAYRKYSYHKSGSLNVVEFFDIDGERIKGPENAAIIKTINDEFGNNVGEYFYDENEIACINSSGYHFAIYTSTKDSVTYSYFDCNEKPCLKWGESLSGVHKSVMYYNKSGDQIESRYCGIDGLPCYDIYGRYRIINEYDGNHRLLNTSFISIEGRQENDNFGNSGLKLSYDKYNRIVERFFLVGQKIRSYCEKLEYSEGFVIKYQTLNSYGYPIYTKLVGNTTGYKIERNDIGQITCISFLDIDDSKMKHNSGMAKVEYEYDINNNCNKLKAYDTDGITNACNNSTNVCSQERVFDSNGRVVSEKSYDVNDNLLSYKKYEYTDQGLISAAYNFNGDEQLVSDNFGVAAYKRNYYKNGRLLSEEYYGVDGTPVYNKANGFAKIKYGYNARLQLTDTWGYNSDLIPDLSNLTGAYHVTQEYDERGNVVLISFYDTKDMPCKNNLGYHKEKKLWHRYINNSGTEYLDEKDSLVNVEKFGLAYYKSEFDEFGRQIEMSCYDKERRPSNASTGYHKQVQRFHKSGQLEYGAFYDKDNNLVSVNGQSPKIETLYNDEGKSILQLMFTESDVIGIQTMNVLDTHGNLISVISRNNLNGMIKQLNPSISYQWIDFDDSNGYLIQAMDSLSNVLIERFKDL